jgi:hypothetical protein
MVTFFSFGNPRILSPWRAFCIAWKVLIEDYTSRKTTFEKDKLIAPAGLAGELHRKLGGIYEYMAGLGQCRTTIEHELC